MKTRPVLERDVVKGCIDALKVFGCDPRRRHIRHDPVTDRDGNIRRRSDGKPVYCRSEDAGLADITATLPGLGTRLEVEVKRPGMRPRADQYEFLIRTNRQGAIGVWCDDAAWLIRAIPHFLRGAKVTLEFGGEPELYYPSRGAR